MSVTMAWYLRNAQGMRFLTSGSLNSIKVVIALVNPNQRAAVTKPYPSAEPKQVRRIGISTGNINRINRINRAQRSDIALTNSGICCPRRN